jgi:ABC-type Fe3+ transport system permease subunit
MKVPQFLLKAKERTERFLKGFEWTWTKAVVFCLAFGFFTLITMAVIPSFWLYFAEQKLGWDGLSGTSDWHPLARDAVAMGLATGPFITVVIAATILQNWRRKLRGSSSDRPAGGYR